jgi:hypothetical protein
MFKIGRPGLAISPRVVALTGHRAAYDKMAKYFIPVHP